MPRQVPINLARERNRVLRELSAAKNLEFRKTFVGKMLDVITLQTDDKDSTEALSDNYLKVKIPGRLRPNEWMRAAITKVTPEGLLA